MKIPAGTTPAGATPVGYSGTPLVKKLGIRPGYVVSLHHAPDDFLETLGELPPDVTMRNAGSAPADIVHYFATRRADLAKAIEGLGRTVHPDGAVWISWRKKTTKPRR